MRQFLHYRKYYRNFPQWLCQPTLRWLLFRFLAVIIAASLASPTIPKPNSDSAQQRGPRPRKRPPQKKTCGVERWAVKTLIDAEGEAVAAKMPMPNTVHGLASLEAPSEPELKREQGRFPPETHVYRVSVLVIGAKEELGDHDFHIVLADPDAINTTMIAEIPAGACVEKTRAKFFDDLRSTFSSEFVRPEPDHVVKLPTAAPACFTGVGFFDFLHGQTGVAPNGIELHPVLAFQKGFCR